MFRVSGFVAFRNKSNVEAAYIKMINLRDDSKSEQNDFQNDSNDLDH